MFYNDNKTFFNFSHDGNESVDLNSNEDFTNLTTTSSISTTIPPLVSDEIRFAILKYFDLVLLPIIGSTGVVTNIISGIVVVKSGLQKPSNIFLLGLAVSDWMCMLKCLNVAWMLSHWRHKMPQEFIGWEMSYSAAYSCYVVDKLLVRVSNFASAMSSSIIVLITIERFIAIFHPLQFAAIVTPRRAWITLISVTTGLLPIYIFKAFLNDFAFYVYPSFNATMGTFTDSEFLKHHRSGIKIFELYVINLIEMTIPVAVVTCGCLLMSIKLAATRRKRRELVQGPQRSKSQSTSLSRTTKTLLAICLLFFITRVSYLFIYLPIFDADNPRTANVAGIFTDVRWSLTHVNSAANIFVYVSCNDRFKVIIKDLLLPGRQASLKRHLPSANRSIGGMHSRENLACELQE